MPLVELVDAVVELLGVVAFQIEIAVDLPAQVGIGVLVGKAHRAAAANQPGQQNKERRPGKSYQKLSTVMCPGFLRRCLRSPRSTSALVASLSISGLPHSMTWQRSSSFAPAAAASSPPSRIAAGMRPASDPAWGSRLTKVT